MPFIRRESENWPFGVPAVTDADLVAGQVSYLDTIAVCKAQRAFSPVQPRFFWLISECSASHSTTSLIGVFVWSAHMATNRSGITTYGSHSTLRLTDINGSRGVSRLNSTKVQ